MGTLTDIQLRQWVKSGAPLAGKSDGEGLTFTLSNTGTAAWVLRYRINGKRKELSIGRYPDLGLKEAREMASRKRAEIYNGVDVATKKQQDKLEAKSAGTVEELAKEFYTAKLDKKLRRPELIKGYLENDIIPAIGKMRVADVTGREVDRVLKRVLDRGAKVLAKQVLQTMKQLFDYAWRRHWINANPAAPFKPIDAGGPRFARERVLSCEEIAQLLKAMRATPSFTYPNYLAVKLLLITCVRKNELLQAEWSEFDLEAGVWHLPGARTKMNADLDIPLPDSALACLRALKDLSWGSDYILPARVMRGKQHVGDETLNVPLRKLANKEGIAHFTVHDLRRTARTQLAALGIAPHVAELCLGHKVKGIEGIYNRHNYLDERRQALNTWADLIEALESDDSGKVVPIKQDAA